jgi:hypothetical protein
MGSASLRAAVALLLTSVWLVLLLTGFHLGGATHLALLGALVVFPWRWVGTRGNGGD